MNRHTIWDDATVYFTRLEMGGNRFFSQSIESPPLSEHLDNTTVHVPEIHGPGRYDVGADTIVGDLDPAFYIVQWNRDDCPTIIYHHGNDEHPFDFSPRSRNTFHHIFLNNKKMMDVNLITLRAPFHDSGSREYYGKMVSLSHFAAMLCVSVKLIEHLVTFAGQGSKAKVVVAGISLGGFITNLHRTFYNTASAYVPLLAGSAFGDVFVASQFSRLTGKQALRHPDAVRSILNFEEDFSRVKDHNVFPLLAGYDRYVEYDRQSTCYGDLPIRVIKRGHITAAMSGDLLREHILEHV